MGLICQISKSGEEKGGVGEEAKLPRALKNCQKFKTWLIKYYSYEF